MTKSQALVGVLGAVLMSWGGASIDSHLALGGGDRADVAFFAIGVILLAQLPYLSLSARLRRLERRGEGATAGD